MSRYFAPSTAERSDGPWRRSELRVKAALLAVAVVFVALGGIVAVKTPAWESADESGHVLNVETLVAGHLYRIPRDIRSDLARADAQRRYEISLRDELHQPPLYYLALAGLQKLAAQPPHVVSPGSTSLLPGGTFLHHSKEQHRFLLLLRFPNVLIGLLTLCFTFLAARLVSKDRWTPLVATAFVAFVPRFVFGSAFVSNDNLVNLLGAVLAYVSLRAVLAPSSWRAAGVGAVLGLLVITKLSSVPALALIVPVVAASRGWRARASALGATATAMLLVCGWYLIQNDIRYGDVFAIGASQSYLTPLGGLGNFLGAPYVITDPLRLVFSEVPSRILRDFWYTSGWNTFHWPALVNLVFWSSLVFALSGLVASKTRRRVSHPPEPKAVVVLVVLAAAGFISVWMVAFSTASYAARLAFLGLSALGCLVALGLERWRPAIRLLVPLLGFCGTLVAIQQDVLSIAWNR